MHTRVTEGRQTKRARMHTRVTEGARQDMHEKRETTRTATKNGLSRSTDLLA